MKTRAGMACLSVAALVLSVGSGEALAVDSPEPERITITVVVTDGKTEKPVNQAHLTLLFRDKAGRASRTKVLSYSAKTDAQGRCHFVYIPEGTVRLLVTEPGYQAFGREFDVSKQNSTLEVKLKPPQPLL